VAYPFLMGQVEGPGDLIGHAVFAVVFVVLLLIPVARKRSRMQELEARLEGLDGGETDVGPSVADGRNEARIMPVAAEATTGEAKP